MNLEPVRVLLIEDNAADVYMFRKALQSAELNFELTVIEEGARALAWVESEEESEGGPLPDLVVVDLNLPRNDGIQILRAIRQSERLRSIPVVITSSSPSAPAAIEEESLEIAQYIRKPPDLDEFLQIGRSLRGVLLGGRGADPGHAES